MGATPSAALRNATRLDMNSEEFQVLAQVLAQIWVILWLMSIFIWGHWGHHPEYRSQLFALFPMLAASIYQEGFCIEIYPNSRHMPG